MTTPIHVLGFAGSLRKGSYNAALLRAASEILPASMTLEIFDLAPIPLYNADEEAAGFPEPVQRFKERIAAADALLIATPEYNYSVPGVLKNALDWASRPPAASTLSGKPMAMMGVGGRSGTIRAQLQLRQIALGTNLLPLNRPELAVAMGWEKFDAEGRLTDEATREQLGKLLVALADWTWRLRNV
ncbi:MAG: NAD(P)H-dependent oxidoreductase [Chloroflexales bacterium]|nr:NAD(P)H-dependent oxidoreductase [Chloroflexales bacterium]